MTVTVTVAEAIRYALKTVDDPTKDNEKILLIAKNRLTQNNVNLKIGMHNVYQTRGRICNHLPKGTRLTKQIVEEYEKKYIYRIPTLSTKEGDLFKTLPKSLPPNKTDEQRQRLQVKLADIPKQQLSESKQQTDLTSLIALIRKAKAFAEETGGVEQAISLLKEI